jgi:hypothetical protein
MYEGLVEVRDDPRLATGEGGAAPTETLGTLQGRGCLSMVPAPLSSVQQLPRARAVGCLVQTGRAVHLAGRAAGIVAATCCATAVVLRGQWLAGGLHGIHSHTPGMAQPLMDVGTGRVEQVGLWQLHCGALWVPPDGGGGGSPPGSAPH